jgi:tetratricopeptide (TPR) repeat protein
VLRYWREEVGDEHSTTLGVLNNLGMTYRYAGRIDEAIDVWTFVESVLPWVVGDEHPHALMAKQNLAEPLGVVGASLRAESLLAEPASLQPDCVGSQHPDTLLTIATLSMHYAREQRWIESQLYSEIAMHGRSRALGDSHPLTLDTARVLATAYRRSGRPHASVSVYEQALHQARRSLSPADKRLGWMLKGYGLALIEAGAPDRAEETLHEAFDQLLVSEGRQSRSTLSCLSALARLYEQTGRAELSRTYRAVYDSARSGEATDEMWARLEERQRPER